MRRLLDDTPEIQLELAPPEASSVSPQQVEQFLRENRTSSVFIGDIRYALSNVPADRWDGISAYLRSNWSEMSSVHIRALTSMPMARLDSVLSFVTINRMTNEHILRALSVITIADLDDFKTFIQSNGFIQRDLYSFIFAHMPKARWPAFAAFIRQKKFDENIMDLGMVYAKHPVENWEILFHLVEGKKIRDYISLGVIDRLTAMTADDSMAYLSFLKTHQVTEWRAKNVLSDVPANKLECLYSFATAHDLVNQIEDLAKISDAQWDVVTRFILKHPNTSIASLVELSAEQWDAFERFVSQHQMTEGEWISKFSEVSEDKRENLFIYQQEYKPRSHEFYNISKLSTDVWPQFMATIKHHGITSPGIINEFAEAEPNEWEELALFMTHRNINDKYVVGTLIRAPERRYRALLAYVEQFNIQDQHIIEGLASIGDVQQWETIMRLAEPLLQPPLLPENRSTILLAVFEITKREYRIDRAMPVYDEAERQGRIAFALAEIANGQMPEDPEEYGTRLRQTLRTPLNQLLNMNQAARAGATAIDVHAEGRDDATTMAMRLFMQLPYDASHVSNDYEAFISYVNAFPHAFIKTCAQIVLGLQGMKRAGGFAPISADEKITSHGLDVTGREFFARLWNFIHQGTFDGVVDDEALNKERENARIALVRNLAAAYEEDQIVCNPGKIQHIVVGVLQGRLHGVHVDKEVVIDTSSSSQTTLSLQQEETLIKNTVAASLRDFLQTYEPMVKTQNELKAYVDEWLQHERGLQSLQIETYRRQFQADLVGYLALSSLPEQNTGFEKEETLQAAIPDINPIEQPTLENDSSEELVRAEPGYSPELTALPATSDDTEKGQSNVTTQAEPPASNDNKTTNTRNWCNYFAAAAVAGVATAVVVVATAGL